MSLLTGGDKLKSYHPGSYELVNNYGPTENTIVTATFKVDGEYDNIPIGSPIDNVRVYILDKKTSFCRSAFLVNYALPETVWHGDI